MNERIKELAEQAGLTFSHDYDYWVAWDDEIERFAELVRQDEREACAELCDPTPLRPCDCYGCDCGDKASAVRVAEWDTQWSMAKAIRARGEQA